MTSNGARELTRILRLKLSGPGLVSGLTLWCLSLTPSLLPRTAVMQGLVSGISLMLGYGLGAVAQAIWGYLEAPKLNGRWLQGFYGVVAGSLGVLLVVTTTRFVGWQNQVREIFGAAQIDAWVFGQIIPITLLVAALILLIARLIRRLFQVIARRADKYLSPRLSIAVGVVLVYFLVSSLVSGVLVNGFFSLSNEIFAVRDRVSEPGVIRPDSPLRSGSAESLVDWETLGRQGQRFTAGGPTVDDINDYSGGQAQLPIRVYAGLESAAELEDRAELVLDELIRTDAFDRDVLVIATTTGTGWLDPKAIEPLEYMHNGDTAVAGVQYSYLPSWISLLADQQVVQDTSLTVFRTIHDHWSELDEDDRPELYVYGLSLGSYGVESILGSVNVINEPIDGALMSGPPFVNPLHSQLTDNRDGGSPAWLPIYGQGATVRFTGLDNALDQPDSEWRDTRLIYNQHASDPVVFFSEDLMFMEPEWLMTGQRGPDVSPDMRWIPIVTFWQIAVDMPTAGEVPDGYGHNYSTTENVHNWAALTEPQGWDNQQSERLSQFLD